MGHRRRQRRRHHRADASAPTARSTSRSARSAAGRGRGWRRAARRRRATPNASSRSIARRSSRRTGSRPTAPTSTRRRSCSATRTRTCVAVTGNDGRLYLLDGASLGGADHQTPLLVPARSPAAVGAPAWRPGRTATARAGSSRPRAATAVEVRRQRSVAGAGSRSSCRRREPRAGESRDSGRRRWRRWSSTAWCSPRRAASIRGAAPRLPAAERAEALDAGGAVRARRRDRQGLWSSGTTITSFARAGCRPAAARSTWSPTTTPLRLRHPDGALMMWTSLALASAVACSVAAASPRHRSRLRGRGTQLPGGPGQGDDHELCGTCHPAGARRVGAPDARGLAGRDRQDGVARRQGHRRGARAVLDYLATHFKGEAAEPLNLNTAPRRSSSRASPGCCAGNPRR